MSRFFAFIGSLAAKVESWWALGVLLVSTGGFTWLAHQWDALASQGWAAVILVAVFFASLIICALSLIYLATTRFRQQRQHAIAALAGNPTDARDGSISTENESLEMVQEATFTGRTVIIDGKHFVKCIFKDCTIQYSGGGYQLTECRREGGSVVFATHNLAITRALPIIQFAGLMNESVKGSTVEIPLDKFKP